MTFCRHSLFLGCPTICPSQYEGKLYIQYWAAIWQPHRRAQFLPAPGLDKSRSPSYHERERGRSCLLTVRSFALTVGLCCLRWYFLLTVEIWLGLLCLQWKIGWTFLLTVPPVQKLGLVFFAYGSPTVGKKDEPKVKRPQLYVEKTHPSGTRKEHTSKPLSPDVFRWGKGLPHEGVSGSFARGRCRRGRSEIPHSCSKLLLFALVLQEKQRKAKKKGKNAQKKGKNA